MDQEDASTERLKVLKPTWNIVFKIWWSIFWRSCLLGGLIGFLVALFTGIIANLAGLDAGIVGVPLGAVAAIGMGIVALRMMFRVRFPDFKIILCEKERYEKQVIPD